MDKKLQKKYMKIGIIAAAVIVVAGGLMLLNQSEQFQGMMRLWRPTPNKFSASVYKDAMNKAVSPVISAVPTVTASPVPSQVGPSVVISQVPSAIITPVASGVALPSSVAAKYNVRTLPSLTARVLRTAEQNDLKKNPGKYTLTKAQKRSMINLYKQKMKR